MSVIAILVFAVAFQGSRVDTVEREKKELEESRQALLKKNAEIQRKLNLDVLNEEQEAIVHSGSAQLKAAISGRFHLSHKDITFECLLGSGSFGDCYKGRMGRDVVAVKKMRIGLVDEDGFKSFASEVLMLSTASHEK